jgi:hypothetical protein
MASYFLLWIVQYCCLRLLQMRCSRMIGPGNLLSELYCLTERETVSGISAQTYQQNYCDTMHAIGVQISCSEINVCRADRQK